MFGVKKDADRDIGIESRLEEYDSERAAQRGINEMARQGWTASAPQPIFISRKRLLFSRFKPRLLVTFTRQRQRR